MRDLSEKTLSTHNILSGKIIQVQIDEVRLPNGQITHREIVKHPGAVAILAITKNEEIVLVRQFRKALEKTIYELPAGKLDRDEDPGDCAVREMREETGYIASKVDLLTSFYTSPGFANEIIYLYQLMDLQKGEPKPDSDEFVEVAELNKEECMEFVKRGLICDAKTLLAIQLYFPDFFTSSSR